MAEGDAKPLALSDGVVDDPLVLPEDLAICVHKIPHSRNFGGSICQNIICVISIRDKADFLRIRLLSDRKAGFFGNLAHFLF